MFDQTEIQEEYDCRICEETVISGSMRIRPVWEFRVVVFMKYNLIWVYTIWACLFLCAWRGLNLVSKL